MIMVLLRVGYAEFPELCSHRNSSSQKILREKFPQKVFGKGKLNPYSSIKEKAILKHLRS